MLHWSCIFHESCWPSATVLYPYIITLLKVCILGRSNSWIWNASVDCIDSHWFIWIWTVHFKGWVSLLTCPWRIGKCWNICIFYKKPFFLCCPIKHQNQTYVKMLLKVPVLLIILSLVCLFHQYVGVKKLSMK